MELRCQEPQAAFILLIVSTQAILAMLQKAPSGTAEAWKEAILLLQIL